MKKTSKTKNLVLGKGREVIPNIAFRGMSAIMRLMDFFWDYSGKNIKTLNLERGQTVIDYGCGPARYIQSASGIVGENGKVIAIDIHPIAIKRVNEKIRKHGLLNVKAVLAKGYYTGLPDKSADVIYALDMFHMIENPKELLKELARLVKIEGRVIIEDGHQARVETRKKIEISEALKIINETKSFVECKKQYQ